MIFYFSGTGNSAWVARLLAEEQQERLLLIADEMGKGGRYELAEGEKVGFVFPVYAWGPPPLVLEFVRRLDMAEPAYLFFVCTCGDDTGRTASVFSAAVRKKGWRCACGYSVTMPNTYVSLPGFDVDAPDVEERKVQHAKARVQFINEELRRMARREAFDCYEGTVPFFKTYVLRPFFHALLMSPRPFHATDACIGCNKCEAACPVHNVVVAADRRPHWGADCTHCLACYHVCPVHTVQYGKRTRTKGQYKRYLGR